MVSNNIPFSNMTFFHHSFKLQFFIQFPTVLINNSAWFPHGIHVHVNASVLYALFYAILLTIQWPFIHTTYLYAFLPYIPQ